MDVICECGGLGEEYYRNVGEKDWEGEKMWA